MSETTTKPVWFISGCSTRFGSDLASAVLERGFRAVVTARDAGRVADLVEGHEEDALAVSLDVTNQTAIDRAVAAAIERFGRIDVLVNNAGYGYQSTVEEGEEQAIRDQFDANVFGLFALTRAVLPILRKQRGGHVINITSVAGLVGFPGSGYYAASKHAVEGWSDALAVETAPLGIKVTCVEPGPFRTDWAGRSLKQTKTRIDDYKQTAGARMEATAGYSGQQKGDPKRAVQAMIDIALTEAPPRHYVLGAQGLGAVLEQLKQRVAEIEAWEEKGKATDFPEE